jgi:hypothetical protein
MYQFPPAVGRMLIDQLPPPGSLLQLDDHTEEVENTSKEHKNRE